MITLEEFIKKVEEEFSEIAPGTLTADSQYQDLFEWSSLNALLFMGLVKAEFDKDITVDDLKKHKTPGELYAAITND